MADKIPSNKSLLGKLLRLPLQVIPDGTIVPILRGAERGLKWIVGSGPDSCWLGINEVSKRRQMAAVIKPGQVVYDIGANVGSYTILASLLVGTSGKVLAFEPLPENLSFLRKHTELNNLRNVAIYDAAVWKSAGTIRFTGTSDRVTSHVDASGDIEVQTVSIDQAIAENQFPPPAVMKIDVEGAEVEVLQGAQKTISEYRPAIFLATHGAEIEDECKRMLRELGYQVELIEGHSDEFLATPAESGSLS